MADVDFNKMTVAQLKEYAKERNIKIKSGIKKAEIVAIIQTHEELVGSDQADADEVDMEARTDLKMTIQAMKDFAAAREIKIPSGATKKAEISAYINGYLDELALGSDPTELGDNTITQEMLNAVDADLEQFARYKERAWLKHLHVHGWTVVPGVFSDELVTESVNSFWNWLEGCDAETKIDRNNPETWSYNSFPSAKSGLIKNYIGQERFLWNLRRAAKSTFEEIYRDPKTKETVDLVCSFDGAIFALPTEKPTSWFHFDQPRDMDAKSFSCVQGIACLTDSGTEDGGFCFILPDDKDIGQFFEDYHARHPSCGIIWGKVNMNDEEVAGANIFKVCANKGDLILFDSRLMHCNVPPNQNGEENNHRMATYISFQPRDNVDEAIATSRMQLFEQGRMTGHWCYGSWFTAQPIHYHTYGKNKVTPPELDQPAYDEVSDMI